MKRLFLLSLVLAFWSCGEYSDWEELRLNLQQVYTTKTPQISYELEGGDFTQGLVRLYKVVPPYGDREYVVGSEVFLPTTNGNTGEFSFRSDLKEGAYVVRSSVVATRAGTVSERLGSAREDFFSISLNSALPPKPPVLSLKTDWYSGILNVQLDHPQYLPEWWNNPYEFWVTFNSSNDPMYPPSDPPDPVRMGPNPPNFKWPEVGGAPMISPGNSSLRMKAVTFFSYAGTPSPIAALSHDFSMDLMMLRDEDDKDYLNDPTTTPLDKSNLPDRLFLKLTFSTPTEGSRLLVRIVNVASFHAVELFNSDTEYTQAATVTTPLEVDFPVDKSALRQLSTYTSPMSGPTNCVVIAALEDYGFTARLINVVE